MLVKIGTEIFDLALRCKGEIKMRISYLNAPNRCTPGGEHKDNTFAITLEMTASDLGLLTSAFHWQQVGMEEELKREDRLPFSEETEADWRETIEQSKGMENILQTISNVIF